MDIAKLVGENLKQARKDNGYTQKQVAEIFHMTQQQYSRFENGVFELNYSQITELCKLLNVTPNDLFDF
jgi:transcriptional regulator with XRE-family HTH domain